MPDPFGFGTNLLGLTTRPGTDARILTTTDTFAVDCTNSTSQDGTEISAGWLNEVVQNWRTLLRGNGSLVSGGKVVDEDNSDGQLLSSVENLIQRGRQYFAIDTGTPSAMAASITPSPRELLVGMMVLLVAAHAPTGPSNLVLNGLAASPIKRQGGLDVAAGDWAVGDMLTLRYSGTAWQLMRLTYSDIADRVQFLRPLLQSNTSYYVNATGGNDNNSGLTSGAAFATIQKAINTISKFNLNGFNVVVNVAAGTYGQVSLLPLSGSGGVTFLGDAATPQNVIISSTSGSAIVSFQCTGYTFNGFQLKSSAPNNASADGGCGIIASGSGNITLENVWLGPCSGAWVSASNAAQVTLAGNVTVQGTLTANSWVNGSGFNAQFGGSISSSFPTNPTLTVSGLVTVAGAFVCALSAGTTFLLFSSISFASNVTGPKYYAVGNGNIDTNAGGPSYYPGSAAGFTSSGGEYI